MKTFNHNKIAAVASVMAIALFAAGAQADEANSFTVRYSDLNLNTAAGATVLYQRIHRAAKDVCGEVDAQSLKVAAAVKACEDQAIERSVRAVNNDQLTGVANQHGLGMSTGITLAAAR
jgi:UrcA family protein